MEPTTVQSNDVIEAYKRRVMALIEENALQWALIQELQRQLAQKGLPD